MHHIRNSKEDFKKHCVFLYEKFPATSKTREFMASIPSYERKSAQACFDCNLLLEELGISYECSDDTAMLTTNYGTLWIRTIRTTCNKKNCNIIIIIIQRFKYIAFAAFTCWSNKYTWITTIYKKFKRLSNKRIQNRFSKKLSNLFFAVCSLFLAFQGIQRFT